MSELQARLAESDRITRAATEGPWCWSEEGEGWGDVGPNLETVERGPVFFDGSQGAKELVVGSWGHDANGINVDPADAHFIAHARTALPEANAALRAVLEMHHVSEYGCESECRDDVGDLAAWPCPTVQAITEAMEATSGQAD